MWIWFEECVNVMRRLSPFIGDIEQADSGLQQIYCVKNIEGIVALLRCKCKNSSERYEEWLLVRPLKHLRLIQNLPQLIVKHACLRFARDDLFCSHIRPG
ncbi:hypothetical protein JTB14_023829 [Gonioctena quinquepunctata]|nr:hypothetical protein JTB14_023829 [Gonioctena quinquepunctata]